MREEVELSVVLVDGEASRVGVAVGRERHVFMDVGHALKGAVWIEAEGKVIEGVCRRSRLGPNAQTEAADYRRARRVEDFSVIGVPLRETHVDHGAVWNRRKFGAFRSKFHVPETNDRDRRIALFVR